jgi:DNA invertase Pin-like site-specific DNA recombinase
MGLRGSVRGECPMRLLQAARLSRLADASTGLDKQDDAANRYADAYGHQIVDTAADTDVSGSVPPWERPKLGPWLTDGGLMVRYDGLIAANLDRLGRNARQLSALRDWAQDNGKKLVVISPPLQWPPEPDDLASPIIWDVLGRLAEYELAAIIKRNKETQKWLRDNGFFAGKPPWGFHIVPKGEHKTLEPDPELEPYVLAMVDRYLDGKSIMDICVWLNAENAASPNGGRWSTTSVNYVLRNPILIGRRTNREGRTVLKVPPIVEMSTWRKLQDKLNANARRRGRQDGPSMLKSMLFCATCGGPMHRKSRTAKGVTYAYYRCQPSSQPSTCKNMIRIENLDEWVNDSILANRSLPYIKTVPISGHGYQDELAQNRQDIKELDPDDPEFDVKLAKLRAERERLQALPSEPDTYEDRPTGKTVGEVWGRLDTAGRRAFLLDHGTRVTATKGKEPTIAFKREPWASHRRRGEALQSL